MKNRKTLPVVVGGQIVVMSVAVRQERGRRIWTAQNGMHWIEPC